MNGRILSSSALDVKDKVRETRLRLLHPRSMLQPHPRPVRGGMDPTPNYCPRGCALSLVLYQKCAPLPLPCRKPVTRPHHPKLTRAPHPLPKRAHPLPERSHLRCDRDPHLRRTCPRDFPRDPTLGHVNLRVVRVVILHPGLRGPGVNHLGRHIHPSAGTDTPEVPSSITAMGPEEEEEEREEEERISRK